MKSVAFALPIKAGGEDAGMKMIEALKSGKHKDLHDSRREHGYKSIKVFRQREPQDMVIVYIEADDVHKAMEGRKGSEHEFESWWEDMVEAATGHHPNKFHKGPVAELLYNWHESKGFSHEEH